MDDYDDDDDVGYYDYDEDDYVSADEYMDDLCGLQRGEKDCVETTRSTYLRRMCWVKDSLHSYHIFNSDTPYTNYPLWERIHDYSIYRRMVSESLEVIDLDRTPFFSIAKNNPFGFRRGKPVSSCRNYSDSRLSSRDILAQLKLKVWYET